MENTSVGLRPAVPAATSQAAEPMQRSVRLDAAEWVESEENAWRSFATSVGEAAAEEFLQSLQGSWEDDVGLSINVHGSEVDFGDGTGVWPILRGESEWELRGTRFKGDPDNPRWEFPNGMCRTWRRPEPLSAEHQAWRELFLDYKEQRLQLRRQLWSSLVHGDAVSAELQAKWDTGAVDTEVSFSMEQQSRLFAGRAIVPGTCFVHRRYGYRGVVVACEPWCTASSAWRQMMGVSNLARGELQPFYHCLVHELDRPGGQMTFVGEENLTPNDLAFPLPHPLVQQLLIRCDELKSYLPGPRLEQGLKRQKRGQDFTWNL
ncbi:unnamed protein product [Effrenium voratum]|uniref:Hemimethylated DNA-binding domain-containing protein n=1 Tax=Effrenium voratum TaxID=2562239 RepID=A0AA36NA75_9DINO|nr:unnamed protein product [Effrenium voratum]